MKTVVTTWLFVCSVLFLNAQKDELPCPDYQQCERAGNEALKNGKTKRAIELFQLQAGHAELADIDLGHVSVVPGNTPIYKLGIQAYNNLAAAEMRRGDYLMAREWCRVTLRWDKHNEIAIQNLNQIEERLKSWTWRSHVSGSYVRYAGRGQWDSLHVKQTGNRISITLFVMRMGGDPAGTPASYGDLEGKILLQNGGATYKRDDEFPCTIRMQFAVDKVELRQDGDCGFGYGVDSTGTFSRVTVK